MFLTSVYILIWCVFLAFVEQREKVVQNINVLGKEKRRVPVWFAIIGFFPIFWLASQGAPRSDTWLYIEMFSNSPSSWSSLIDALSKQDGEWGYTVFCFIIKVIFGNDKIAFRTAIGLMHSIPLILILRKYSSSYTLSLFIFVAACFHTGYMMNGLRQFIAATMIFTTTGWISRKKYIPTIIVILIAFLFHKTAIIMLPVIFFVQGKPWTKKTLLFLAFIVVLMYAFTELGYFDNLLESTGYDKEIFQEDNGANPLRVLVNAIPMVIAFAARNYIDKQEDPLVNICVNMSIVTTGLYLISMVTSGILMGRLPAYTNLFNLILLPYLIRDCFDQTSSRIMSISAIVLYFMYMYVELGGINGI